MLFQVQAVDLQVKCGQAQCYVDYAVSCEKRFDTGIQEGLFF